MVVESLSKGGHDADALLQQLIGARKGSLKRRGLSEDFDDAELLANDLQDMASNPGAAILMFNIALLYYHKSCCSLAMKILKVLFNEMKDLNDEASKPIFPLMKSICFLYMDVLLLGIKQKVHSEEDMKEFSEQTSNVLAFLKKPREEGSSSSTTKSKVVK
jgi:hypothetical protein